MQRPPRRPRRPRRRKGPAGRLFISSDFALLWLKQSVTALCDALFGATLIIWLSFRTNSPFSVGLALVALGAPYALFGPFAEAAAERWSRRRTMFVTDVVRGLLTFLLCLTLLPTFTPKRSLAAIYLLCFCIGLMSRFSLAAQRSAITAVVAPSDHARGISRIQGSAAIMTIAGPVLAAILFLILGATPIPGLILTGFLLLLSAGGAQAMDQQFTSKVRAIRARRRRRAARQDDESASDGAGSDEEEEEAWTPSVLRSGFADGKRGVRLALQQRPFSSVARIMGLVAFVGGIFTVLEVFFVNTYLGLPGADLGLILSASAAGVLLGSVLFGRLDAHLQPTTTFTYGVLGLGVTTAAFVSTRTLSMALIWAAAMGIANGLLLSAAQTALVETSERASLPRLFVGYETLIALLGTIGIFLGSAAAGVISVGRLLGFGAGLLLLAGLGAWLALSGLLARFTGRKAAPRPVDEQEDDFAPLEDADQGYAAEDYEPGEDEAGAFAEADAQDQEDAQRTYRPPSRQFGRLWGNGANAQHDAEDREADEPTYDEDAYQDDASQQELDEPVEEAPAPRRTLRLRPSPWEQGGGTGRTRA